MGSSGTQISYGLVTNFPLPPSEFLVMIQPEGQVRAESKASRKILCCRKYKVLVSAAIFIFTGQNARISC